MAPPSVGNPAHHPPAGWWAERSSMNSMPPCPCASQLERKGTRIIVPTVRVRLRPPVSRRSDADDERATQDDANTGRRTIGTCKSRQKPREKDRTGHHVEDMLLTSFVYLGL